MQEMRVQSLGQGDLLRRKWQSTPILLPEKPHGQRNLGATVHGLSKESDMTERLNNNTEHIHHLLNTYNASLMPTGIQHGISDSLDLNLQSLAPFHIQVTFHMVGCFLLLFSFFSS